MDKSAGETTSGAAAGVDKDKKAPAHAELVGSIHEVKTSVDALKTVLTPAAPAAAPAATSTTAPTTPPAATTAPCCDAYPGEALKEALSMPIDSKTLAEKALPAEARTKLLELNQPIIDARAKLLEKSAWATAPEMALLDACTKEQRPVLARRILEVKAGMTKEDDDRRKAEVKLENERAEVAKVARETLEVGKEQMEKWTGLAAKGKDMLVVSSIFSAVMIIVVIFFASQNKLDAAEAPIIIFILAIFAISPAVLLLRERPLEGLDKFTPSGTTGGSSSESAADGSGEGTAK